jgi:hypothetical protein
MMMAMVRRINGALILSADPLFGAREIAAPLLVAMRSILATGLVMILAAPAAAQDAPPPRRRVLVNVGVTENLQFVAPYNYAKSSTRLVDSLGISGGVLLTPRPQSALRVLLEFDWQTAEFAYQLRDFAGRGILSDFAVRDRVFSQLVGWQVGRSADGPIVVAGIAEVSRHFTETYGSSYVLAPSPETITSRSVWEPGLVVGVDLPLGSRNRGAVARLRGRLVPERRGSSRHLGWALIPGLLIQF